jgi:cellulose synthase/poly-beta-1,6-N-acetylglucosamine synthase-like glycosyltransferase
MRTMEPMEQSGDPSPPLVSVVIPCFEREAYARELLASILAQDFADWEAILVDDGSRAADLGRVVRETGDARCRIIVHERNRGLGPARNTGFAAARGRLVVPVDADDLLAPSFLAATAAALSGDPEADCAYTDLQLFGDSEAVWRFNLRSPADMLSEQWIPGTAALMRRELWERLGGYGDLWGNEDWDFWIAAVRLGIKPIRIAAPLYMYRRTPHSMSATSLRYYEHRSREAIYRRHRPFFDRHHAGRAFRAEGYLRSSRAALRQGQRLRAIRLAIHGMMLAPISPSMVRTLLLAVLPDGVVRLLKPPVPAGSRG